MEKQFLALYEKVWILQERRLFWDLRVKRY